jgi:hypothetical protein
MEFARHAKLIKQRINPKPHYFCGKYLPVFGKILPLKVFIDSSQRIFRVSGKLFAASCRSLVYEKS